MNTTMIAEKTKTVDFEIFFLCTLAKGCIQINIATTITTV